jgi:hypothetical protein
VEKLIADRKKLEAAYEKAAISLVKKERCGMLPL